MRTVRPPLRALRLAEPEEQLVHVAPQLGGNPRLQRVPRLVGCAGCSGGPLQSIGHAMNVSVDGWTIV